MRNAVSIILLSASLSVVSADIKHPAMLIEGAVRTQKISDTLTTVILSDGSGAQVTQISTGWSVTFSDGRAEQRWERTHSGFRVSDRNGSRIIHTTNIQPTSSGYTDHNRTHWDQYKKTTTIYRSP